MMKTIKLFTWRQTKKNLFEATFLGQGRKSEWESSFFTEQLKAFQKNTSETWNILPENIVAAVFARTLKNKFTNTVVPDEAAPEALLKYENCTRKKTNGKYLHESNKN